MLAGTMPVRKSSQEPVLSGAAALPLSTLVREPGSVSRPRAMPIETAIGGRDREPQQGLAGEPHRVGDLAQAADAHDDGEEDERGRRWSGAA